MGTLTTQNPYRTRKQQTRWIGVRRGQRQVYQVAHTLDMRLERLKREIEVDAPC
jgi:hypothetical protein